MAPWSVERNLVIISFVILRNKQISNEILMIMEDSTY